MCERDMEMNIEPYVDLPYIENLGLTKKLDGWVSEAKVLVRTTN